jgi:hypothetical protein
LYGSRGIDVVETRDGGLVAVADYNESYDASDIVIFKTNSAGTLQWSKKFISAKKRWHRGNNCRRFFVCIGDIVLKLMPCLLMAFL